MPEDILVTIKRVLADAAWKRPNSREPYTPEDNSKSLLRESANYLIPLHAPEWLQQLIERIDSLETELTAYRENKA